MGPEAQGFMGHPHFIRERNFFLDLNHLTFSCKEGWKIKYLARGKLLYHDRLPPTMTYPLGQATVLPNYH